jgi:DNA invertase Pin-like site-specific DNA recombinase
MTLLAEQGIGFKSLTENIDTTTSGGKLIFHIFGALAEDWREPSIKHRLVRTTLSYVKRHERGVGEVDYETS